MLDNIDNKYIGEEIRKARKSKRITREQLAEITNIDAKQIYRIEKGQNSPKLENFLKIASVLELDIKYFSGSDIRQDIYTDEILSILKNSSEKELQFYLKLLKMVKEFNTKKSE